MDNFLDNYSKLLDESTEHLSNQAIATYVNIGFGLTNKEKLFIENHLKSCSKCRNIYEKIIVEDKEIDELLSDIHSEIAETSNSKKFLLIKLIKYSAAAVITIAVVLGFYFLLIIKSEEKIAETNTVNTNTDSSVSKSISESTKASELAETVNKKEEKQSRKTNDELFATNDVLENFINRNVRSQQKLKITHPSVGDSVKIPITFNWEFFSQVDSVRIMVVDNKNRTIYDTVICGKEFKLDSDLRKGLYYWKLFYDDKLETVGKFYLK